jgi:ELWxxDGT repeat protein
MVYFSAFSPTTGVELYKTNGTAAGTVAVKDINPGAGNSNPQELTNANSILFFAADDPNEPGTRKLYKSNGTEAGTVLVE